MTFTPYLALIVAIRFAIVLAVVVSLYGAWLIVAELVADAIERRRVRKERAL